MGVMYSLIEFIVLKEGLNCVRFELGKFIFNIVKLEIVWLMFVFEIKVWFNNVIVFSSDFLRMYLFVWCYRRIVWLIIF